MATALQDRGERIGLPQCDTPRCVRQPRICFGTISSDGTHAQIALCRKCEAVFQANRLAALRAAGIDPIGYRVLDMQWFPQQPA